MTKEDFEYFKKLAEKEIKEWKAFLEELRRRYYKDKTKDPDS